VKSERKSKLQQSIRASRWSPEVCSRHNRRIRHNSVVLVWSFISRRLLCDILCKEINCSNDICTVITQLIQRVLCFQYDALNLNVMKTDMYTSAAVSVVVGWQCFKDLNLQRAISDYVSDIIREGSDNWNPQRCEWTMSVYSMVCNMMCSNSEANVTVIELRSLQELQNEILHSRAWRAWYCTPKTRVKREFARIFDRPMLLVLGRERKRFRTFKHSNSLLIRLSVVKNFYGYFV